MGLRPLLDPHLEVDAVADDVDFHGVDVREDVAVVVVVVADGVLVLLQALVQHLLVEDVAALHAEHGVQVVSGDDGVAHPVDVSQEVLLALVHLDVDVDVLLVLIPHRVELDGGIAVAQLVILLEQLLLGLVVAFRGELLGFEE